MALEVLQQKLPAVLAIEGQPSAQQFLVDDGQAVLVAAVADAAFKQFGGRVERAKSSDLATLRTGLVRLHQAEIADLEVVADQKQVPRLDVEVLQTMLNAHQVKHLGGLAKIGKDLVS